MKQTDKRFWNWRTLIVVLIISLLIAIVVFFKRYMTTDTADIERVGNEIIGMIDDFQKMNNRLPIGLNEIGTPSRKLMRPMNTRAMFSITNREKTAFIG